MSFSKFFFFFNLNCNHSVSLTKLTWSLCVNLRDSLKRNPLNSFYIFVLDVKFENLTVGLHVFIFLTYVLNFVQINCYLQFNH